MTIDVVPTTTPTTTVPVLLDERGRTVHGLWGVTITFLRRQPVGSIGLVLVLIFGLGIRANGVAFTSLKVIAK